MSIDSAFEKGMGEPMSMEEAREVWQKAHDMAEAFPDGRRISWLSERLAMEASKGYRCSVCGRYRDSECGTRC